MEKKRKDLIHLQNAHATQHTNDGLKTTWKVLTNETEKLLYELPAGWDDKTLFEALDFAKKFELIALNVGINHGVREELKRFTTEKGNLLKVIDGLTKSNEKLAEKLGKFIGEEI